MLHDLEFRRTKENASWGFHDEKKGKERK